MTEAEQIRRILENQKMITFLDHEAEAYKRITKAIDNEIKKLTGPWDEITSLFINPQLRQDYQDRIGLLRNWSDTMKHQADLSANEKREYDPQLPLISEIEETPAPPNPKEEDPRIQEAFKAAYKIALRAENDHIHNSLTEKQAKQVPQPD